MVTPETAPPALIPTATTAPVEETLNCEVEPTANNWVGEVVPMPTLPLFKIVIATVAPSVPPVN